MKKILFFITILLLTSCEDNIRRDERTRVLKEMRENQFPPAVIEGFQRTIDYKYDDKIYRHDVIFYNLGDKGAVMLHIPECKYCKEEQGK